MDVLATTIDDIAVEDAVLWAPIAVDSAASWPWGTRERCPTYIPVRSQQTQRTD
jgi:hypothetical protein